MSCCVFVMSEPGDPHGLSKGAGRLSERCRDRGLPLLQHVAAYPSHTLHDAGRLLLLRSGLGLQTLRPGHTHIHTFHFAHQKVRLAHEHTHYRDLIACLANISCWLFFLWINNLSVTSVFLSQAHIHTNTQMSLVSCRYSDIIVHRLLAVAIGADSTYPALMDKHKQAALCNNLNYRHKMAQYAQRASVAFHTQVELALQS